MARSPQDFVRGNTHHFYEWLSNCRDIDRPEGPATWICGDCHFGNLGPVANLDGETELRIRDLDQTVVGDPAHDILRLAFSIAIEAGGSGVTTAQAMDALVDGYAKALEQWGEMKPLKQPKLIRRALSRARGRDWKALATERIGDPDPKIPLGARFWRLSRAERSAIETLMERAEVRSLMTARHGREADAPVRMVDAAFWVKGCSSLGRMRYAVLMRIDDLRPSIGGVALIDIKEAAKPACPSAPGAELPPDDAERVVTGARRLSPQLGGRMAAGEVLGRPVFVRELLPQDLKLELTGVEPAEVIEVGRYLAWVVGCGHAGQLPSELRRSWAQALRRSASRPRTSAWLWSSIVDLMTLHERAYLDHCRGMSLNRR